MKFHFSTLREINVVPYCVFIYGWNIWYLCKLPVEFKIKFGGFEHDVVSQYEFVKTEKQEDSVGG